MFLLLLLYLVCPVTLSVYLSIYLSVSLLHSMPSDLHPHKVLDDIYGDFSISYSVACYSNDLYSTFNFMIFLQQVSDADNLCMSFLIMCVSLSLFVSQLKIIGNNHLK
ncbi:hypothetical protein ACOSQ3_028912 [Xanthoceras sorbifolium]